MSNNDLATEKYIGGGGARDSLYPVPKRLYFGPRVFVYNPFAFQGTSHPFAKDLRD
jgi:hypothetical protein